MKFDIEEIKRKNKIVDDAIIKLKKEFVGIDEQIDEVMNSVRTWYLYPELQNRPIVVSIFGLTGTGKTSLIRKIAKYLDIEQDLVYFNFAEIGEMHSCEIEDRIEEELENNKPNRIFVYDEFQYAATLDEEGCEKDNKSCLKPFWELMDSGLLHKRHTIWETRSVVNLLRILVKINSVHAMEIVDGKWVNAEDCLKCFAEKEIRNFSMYLNFKYEYNKKKKEQDKESLMKNIPTIIDDIDEGDDEEFQKRYFVKDDILEQITNIILKGDQENNIDERMRLYNEITRMNYDELITYLVSSYDNLCKGYDLKFNSSIIFVIANLDEAYTISFNVNPDMSPDQFHKITKKITIVDIKEALKKRFRNEQIARLGNIHVIYPSFSSDAFNKLIEMSLDEYSKDVKEKVGYDVVFTSSIKKCIFDEAVYPTHGTRPIFSSIHEIIKSKLPEVVRQLCENEKQGDVSYLEYSFKNKKTIIKAYDKDNKLLLTMPFKEKLRLDKLRQSTKDERQALCAVHESGHFVIYSALTGKLPEKVVSKASESGTGGFLLEQFDENAMSSFNELFNNLQVCLGGYVAERIVFDENMVTSGACKDLEECTVMASRMIREWGFGQNPFVTTYLRGHANGRISGHIIRNEEDDQKLIINLINKAYDNVKQILTETEWRKMFVESCKYLSKNTNMPKNKMNELYNLVPDSVKITPNDKYYRDIVNTLA